MRIVKFGFEQCTQVTQLKRKYIQTICAPYIIQACIVYFHRRVHPLDPITSCHDPLHSK